MNQLVFSQIALKPLVTIPSSTSIASVFDMGNLQHFAIASHNDASHLIGIVSLMDLVSYFARNHSAKLSDRIESVLTLNVDDENYQIWEQDESDTLAETMVAFSQGLHRGVITSSKGRMIVTQVDILACCVKIGLFTDQLKRSVDQWVPSKKLGSGGSEVKSVRDDVSLQTAFEVLDRDRLACLAVLDKEGKLIGKLCKTVLLQLNSRHQAEQLNSPLSTFKLKYPICHPTTSLIELVELMEHEQDSRVFCLEEGTSNLLGVVSASDLIAAIVGITVTGPEESPGL